MPQTTEITAISSMATRILLADLARAYEARSGARVALESVGGVDVARRVQAGEPFDVVVLARAAIEKLLATGHLIAGTETDVVRSGVAVAVRAGAARPEIGSEDALRSAVLAARTIGISTGPSGVALGKLFHRWGIAEQIRNKVVIPRPGLPVGALVARGEVELGFQQWAELIGVHGIEVVGPLPPPVQIVTTFTASVGAASRQPAAARALLDFLCSAAVEDVKRRHGMDPPEHG